jgi:multidrug transporter EmrE-like cation transporter
MLKTSAALAVGSVILATAGQLLLKAGMDKVGFIGGERLGKPLALFRNIALTPQVVVGLAIFVASAAFWLVVLSRVPLSFAYPFAGLVYVLTTVFSRFILHEHVPAARWIGIALIIIGIVVVGQNATTSEANKGATATSSLKSDR